MIEPDALAPLSVNELLTPLNLHDELPAGVVDLMVPVSVLDAYGFGVIVIAAAVVVVSASTIVVAAASSA